MRYPCVVSIIYGGVFAFLITRTNLAFRGYLSSIFIFPYIMPQWTLAVVWQNLFNSNAVTGTSNGLLAALFGIEMPLWWCKGMFPSLMVLGLHYAPFAYILIGGIFQNMDANLEEAATILDTPFLFGIGFSMASEHTLSSSFYRTTNCSGTEIFTVSNRVNMEKNVEKDRLFFYFMLHYLNSKMKYCAF